MRRSEWRRRKRGRAAIRLHDIRSHREGAGGIVDSHVFQHIGCCLNRPLTNLVHADFVPAAFAGHKGFARNVLVVLYIP
jgi:hypothetical protein